MEAFLSDTLSENETRYLTQEEDNDVMNYEESETEEFENITLIDSTQSQPLATAVVTLLVNCTPNTELVMYWSLVQHLLFCYPDMLNPLL
jgi:hypothetical protein